MTKWSPQSITFQAFGSAYGSNGWVVTSGERLAIEVWNANTLAGPAIAYATAGQGDYNNDLSSIAASLPTPAQAFSPITTDIVNALIAIGLAMFLTFPSNLFNSTFQENYEQIAAWWRKWYAKLLPDAFRRRVKSAAGRGTEMAQARARELARLVGRRHGAEPWRPTKEQLRFGAVLLAGALLGSLLDPKWGPNFRSVLSFVSIVIAMVTGVAFSGLMTHGYHRARKHGQVEHRLEALPGGLLIAVACVLISRGMGFTPGYLYGIVCGLSFSRELAKNEQGHLVALEAWGRVVLAFAAWFAWAALTHDASKPSSFFGLVLVEDFLASLFVSSMVGTVISLIPLQFLPGHKLRKWHPVAWALTFAGTLFTLVQIFLRPHSTSSGPSHVPLVTTLVLFAFFGGGSVLFRRHFVLQRRRQEETATAIVDVTEQPGAAGEVKIAAVTTGPVPGEVELREKEVNPQPGG